MSDLPANIVFFDCETNGMSPARDRIIDVGLIRVENGTVVKEVNMLLDPEAHIPDWITRLTGIDQDMVAGQPKFSEKFTEINELLQDAVFVAHNVDFDYGFLQGEFLRLGERLTVPKLCTVRLSRALYPLERKHNLDEVVRRHNITIASRHRAYDDAFALWEFWQQVGSKAEPHLSNLIQHPPVSRLNKQLPLL